MNSAICRRNDRRENCHVEKEATLKEIAENQCHQHEEPRVWTPSKRTRVGADLPRRWPIISLFFTDWIDPEMSSSDIAAMLWDYLGVLSEPAVYQLLTEALRLPAPTPTNSLMILKALRSIGGELEWSAETAGAFVADARELAGLTVAEMEGR